MKKEVILKEYQEPFYLKYYLEKAKEQYKIKNKNDKTIIIQNWLKKVKSYKNVKEAKKKKNNNNLKKMRVKILVENLYIQ